MKVATLFLAGLLTAVLFLVAPVAAQAGTVPACSIDNPPNGCEDLYALQVDVTAPHGAYVFVPNPGCMNDSMGALHDVVQAAVVAGVPELAEFSGSISDLAAPAIAEQLAQHGGFISEHLSPYAKNGAMCVPVVAVIPTDATYVGYRFMAHDQTGWSGCHAATDCGIGWSRFQSEPQTVESEGMHTVIAMFMNWSHDRNRTARMIVFYRMPPGKTPAVEL